MDDAKRVIREGETRTKGALRELDGHDLSDDIGNAGDDIRKDLGNLGDAARRAADRARDESNGTPTR
jgi:hypothetical protein